jgi:CBS domain-containing protein
MRVEDLMTRDVWTASPRALLRRVAEAMAAEGISGLPVVEDDGRVVGVVSEADVLAKVRGPRPPAGRLDHLLRRAATDPASAKLDAVVVREAMTSPAITIAPDTPATDASALMLERNVDRLPVVGPDGGLLGIVTRADLVRGIAGRDGG